MQYRIKKRRTILKYKILILTTLWGNCLLADTNREQSCRRAATPYFNIRSQGINAARDLVGVQQFVNRCCADKDNFYGFAGVTIEHDQTFKSHEIARSLFGDDVVCTSKGSLLSISGSTATDRGAHDWLADYFGLPTDFKSTVLFKPEIKNLIADISFYWGLNQWADGLYFRFDIPLVHTSWNLNFCECISNPGTQNSWPGAFIASTCPTELSRSLLFPNATDFFCGEEISLIRPLEASKWFCGCNASDNKTVASVNIELGWNFVCGDDYHFGAKVRTCAPTGNRPTGQFLFEQIIGNGHHWGLGGGISTHSVLCRNYRNDSTFSFYLEANITHLFKACQTRSFDLCGKPNSRYMLAERLGPNIENLSGCPTTTLCSSPILSNNQAVVDLTLVGDFTSVANLTKTLVDVSIAVQADIALKFAYNTGCGFEWDLGYNFWARSREKICRRKCASKNPLDDGTTWGLKGDAMTFGTDPSGTFHQLAATEHCATIHTGTNGFVPGDELANELAFDNPGIDNPQFAFVNGPFFEPVTDAILGHQMRTSIQPVYLTNADVNLRGTNAFSNKIFTHLNYTWSDIQNWNPFLGVGASVEFGHNDYHKKNSSASYAITQWGAWIKGGVAFDHEYTSSCKDRAQDCTMRTVENERLQQEKDNTVNELEHRINDLESRLLEHEINQATIAKQFAEKKDPRSTEVPDLDIILEHSYMMMPLKKQMHNLYNKLPTLQKP